MKLTILLLIVTTIHANRHNANSLENDMRVNEIGNWGRWLQAGKLGMVKRQWETRKLRTIRVPGTVPGLLIKSNKKKLSVILLKSQIFYI